MPETKPEVKKRADAQANYDRILGVALEALTADPDASLNSIAKTAGVGAGTLYRHFPTRDHLVVAAYRHEVEELVDAAYSPWLADLAPTAALRTWFDRMAQYGMTKVGLKSALDAATQSVPFERDEIHNTLTAAIFHLLERGQAAGELRADLSAEDVLLAVGFLWRLDPASDWRPQAARLLDLVVDGLRAAPVPAATE
ncbi:TetR/AcrR family transcriptional regulator [Gryllotalpicola protaetiae]|uniref:TetR/AcrR family transcriptional regulator n=1 Tax=Gryllotalpicola protaetiae TaxID=2419771 RepID=A0A387BZ37_9MICO|nr:TetR/AcrR family transcriptional regulator [Gryllotalpicola protaetiae]AYG03591.1 TetR/AcrR family transcriptional regulator [Gryllotalpicola protaetiae]